MNAVNDAPEFVIDSQVATEDVTHDVVFVVTDEESDATDFEYGFSVNNENLFNLDASEFDISNDGVTLNLVPSPNANGTASITVTVTDNEHVVVQSFTITVNAVNDAPEFVIDAQVATEDVTHDVVFVVTDEEGDVSDFEYGFSVNCRGRSGGVKANPENHGRLAS